MSHQEFTIINTDDEQVKFTISGTLISPSLNFRTACKWYSLNILTKESKAVMEKILDNYVSDRCVE